MAEDAGALSGLDTATLEPMVRDLLGEPAAVVAEGWSCRPLGGGAGEGLGLYRRHRFGACRGCLPSLGARLQGVCGGGWRRPGSVGLPSARGAGLWLGSARCTARWACCPALPGRRDAARRDELALARGGHRRAPRSVAARALRPGRPRAWPLQRRLPRRSTPA